MANNTYEATGVLHLERVTPVIRALFNGFNLDETDPGNGQAYIAIADEAEHTWERVLEDLTTLATQLGIPTPGKDKDDENAHPMDIIFEQLAKHFGASYNEELDGLIENHDFDGDGNADLETLFFLANCFNDGHNLTAIEYEGCWYCSKLRLFEFGGDAAYLSKEIQLYSTSSTARLIGPSLRHAIVSNDVNDAAKIITQKIQAFLTRIPNKKFRTHVTKEIAFSLINSTALS